MPKLTTDQLIKVVTDSFDAERTHDVARGLELIAGDFTQRPMAVVGDEIFPVFVDAGNIEEGIRAAYAVEGREFHIWNVAANEETQTVFVELAEVEPRDSGMVVWPYTLVCQIENGKIARSRHYGDPAVLKRNVSVEQVRGAVTS